MENREENKKNKKKWLLLLLLALIAIGAGTYFYFSQKEPVRVVSGEYLPDKKGAKKMTDKEVQAAEQKEVDASKFNMVIKPEAIFQNSKAKGKLFIQNPEANAYPIEVVITLDGAEAEQVYSSGAIEPGYEITEAKLEKALPKGKYPATATFNIYDPKTKEKRGQVQASITIVVSN
ncbi:hypothetical protein BCR26_01725 [Enterococcus rivorum]|uniref:Uncharacterized protein n=1 Tax=Enterococcus rivorum TaxID=762845 RepID=A0A1E5KYT3_9ENTE|nr:hypothetical protein BCR26_01725 [Enterococcus rivorum]